MELAVLMGQGVGTPEPAGQYEPAGQAFEQDAAPIAGEYMPAVQLVQTVAPLRLYVPAAHGLQDDAPAALDEPAAQDTHAAKDVLPVFGLNLPAAHLVHEAAPTTGEERESRFPEQPRACRTSEEVLAA